MAVQSCASVPSGLWQAPHRQHTHRNPTRNPQVIAQLSHKNEQLVLRSTKVSEDEMAAVVAESQARIAALEKKVGLLAVRVCVSGMGSRNFCTSMFCES